MLICFSFLLLFDLLFPRRGGICICVLYFQTGLSTWNCPPLPMNGYGHKIRPPTPTQQHKKTKLVFTKWQWWINKDYSKKTSRLAMDGIDDKDNDNGITFGVSVLDFVFLGLKCLFLALEIWLFDEKSFFVCYQALFVCLSLPGTWTFL